MIYYIRATEMETCTQITDRVMNIARGAALMTDTKVSFEWDSAAFNILVNQTLVRAMYENLESLFPLPYRPEDYAYMKPFQETLSDEAKAKSRRSFEENFPKEDRIALERMATSSINDRLFPLHFSDDPIYISTDVGDVSWVCPVGQISVAYGPNGSPLHSWQWVATGKSHVAHVALLTAAKTIALTGIDLIEEPNLLAQVKAEHKLNLNGRTYHSPNPKVYAGWE
jgi:aminobenzoyl-glutamate utilization protein B